MIAWLESPGFDPYRNLAIEEQLLDLCGEGPVLYLWQNDRTVVIGRNQDAERECPVGLMEAEEVRLARRLSGGGAVYHDLGNLNFSFLARREDYSVSRQTEIVCGALARLGADVAFSGRNDLEIYGQKLSGSAFYERGDRLCHHGTVMVEVDREAMARYLTASESKLSAKGVPSVRARVTNLRDILPDVTVEQVKTALIEAFSSAFGESCTRLELSTLDAKKLPAGEARFRDPAWIYGRRVRLPIEMVRRFPWGEVSVRLRTAGGRIAEAAVWSDALDPGLTPALQERLTGAAVDRWGLLAALEGCPALKPVKRDLAEWLAEWEEEYGESEL